MLARLLKDGRACQTFCLSDYVDPELQLRPKSAEEIATCGETGCRMWADFVIVT